MKDNPISKEDTAKIQKDIIKGDNPKAQIPEKVSEKQDNKEKSQYIPIRITSTPKQNMEIETHNRYNPLVDIDPETTLFKIPHTGNINQTTAPLFAVLSVSALPQKPHPTRNYNITGNPHPRKIEIKAELQQKTIANPTHNTKTEKEQNLNQENNQIKVIIFLSTDGHPPMEHQRTKIKL